MGNRGIVPPARAAIHGPSQAASGWIAAGRSQQMTIGEAAAVLRDMRRKAPAEEVSLQAKYHDQLAGVSLSARMGDRTLCDVQLRHGIKLAKYVKLRK